jgi:hypothetical protein
MGEVSAGGVGRVAGWLVVLKFLPLLVEIGLLIYGLIDCAQSSDRDIRTMPKWAWFLVIILLPVIGTILWLIAGRPHRARHGNRARQPGSSGQPGDPGTHGGPTPHAGPLGPDDDPEFLDRLRREQERRRQQQPPADPETPE